MSETFTIKVRLEYDDKVAPWRTVPILHDLVRSLFLNGLNPSKLREDFSGTSSDDKSFERTSLHELEAAFRNNYAVPVTTEIWLFYTGHPVNVWESMYFSSSGKVQMDVIVSGSSRIEVDRLAKEIFAGMSASAQIRNVAPDREIEISELKIRSTDKGTSEKRSSRAGFADAASISAPVVQPSRLAWFRQSWREHAAQYLVAVLAGVTLLVIGALVTIISG